MAKVLLIEDDKFLRNLLAKRLKSEDVDVITAVDGEDGLQKIISDYPDLVLLDLILPKRSGFSFLDEINKDINLKKVPIIILSNLGQEEDVQRAKEYQVKDYMIKANSSLEQIIGRIKNFLAAEVDGKPADKKEDQGQIKDQVQASNQAQAEKTQTEPKEKNEK